MPARFAVVYLQLSRDVLFHVVRSGVRDLWYGEGWGDSVVFSGGSVRSGPDRLGVLSMLVYFIIHPVSTQVDIYFYKKSIFNALILW